MMKSLSEKLRKSIDKITRLVIVDKHDVEELIKEIQHSLLASDVDVKLVFELSEKIRKRAFEKLPPGLSRKEHIIKTVYEELTNILGKEKPTLELRPKRILLVGLFGSGKTTTAAKLARFYQKKGLKPALICCDVVRPAAYEQLQQLAEKLNVPFFGIKNETDSSKVLSEALKKIHADVIIVDSSGRNALDENLISEIKKLNEILKPDEKILVIPADIGQAAKEQSKKFNEALGITDVIVTKMDATAKGGGALTACNQTDAKVMFITTGETPDDIELYDPKRFVARLIGFPDLETLLEKVRSVTSEEKAEKILTGDFTLDDFVSQIGDIGKVGSFSQIIDMMGLGRLTKKLGEQKLTEEEEKMKKWKHIVKSMTPEERANPDIINSSRIHRIAKGSGVDEHSVRELLANYNKIKKMMKKVSPGKLKRSGLGGLLRHLGI